MAEDVGMKANSASTRVEIELRLFAIFIIHVNVSFCQVIKYASWDWAAQAQLKLELDFTLIFCKF